MDAPQTDSLPTSLDPSPRHDASIAEATVPADTQSAPVLLVPGYTIECELGRGGMGVVYKARQTTLDRTVALKMILVGVHASEDGFTRFRTEAEAIARLRHPHIVQIHEIGEHDGLPYFTLEYCPGGNLGDKLNNTPMVPTEAARLVQTLAHAIQAAHDKGIIHRDLKLANVLLSEDGAPKITDFGLVGQDLGRPHGCGNSVPELRIRCDVCSVEPGRQTTCHWRREQKVTHVERVKGS